MTISSVTNRNTYNGNGATTVFAYTFKILDDDDILVQWKDTTTGVITTKTKTTHYTVSNVGASGGGNITFTTGNEPPSGTTVIFTRDMDFLQETDYTEYDAFPAETHEEALDRLTMYDLQQQLDIDQSIKLDVAVSGFDTILPTPTADYFLKVNSGGDGFEFINIASLGTLSLPVSISNGGTGATSASAARTALGLVIGTDVQAFDSDLASIAALSTTSYGRSLLTLVDEAALRTSAGLVIGTDVQAFDSDLASIAALSTTSLGRSFLTLTDPNADRIVFWDDSADSTAWLTVGSGLQISGTTLSATGGVTNPINNVNVQIFPSSGTYTPTSGMQYCIVEVVGGGGGGGGVAGNTSQTAAGGGGGGGGYSSKRLTSATIGASQSVTIGAGGSGGSAGANNGSSGGTTSLGALLQATGGAGGEGSSSSAVAVHTLGGEGGVGSSGTVNSKGDAGYHGVGVVGGQLKGGSGGGTAKGGGGLGAVNGNAGVAGGSYGGGGSGAAAASALNLAGGSGADGVVIITEYISA